MKNLLFLLTLLLVAGSENSPVSPNQKKLKVITTLGYLQYVTEQIGGEKIDVTALVNPKQDPHYVTPTPRMNELARGADLFIETGLNLDLWAKNVVDASGNPRIQSPYEGRLIASINVPILELPLEISRAWGDIHPQGNPHVWLDPINIKLIAENIAARLERLDRANGPYYHDKLRDFKNRIDVALFGEELIGLLGTRGGDILSRKARSGDLERWLQSKDLNEKLGGWMNQSRSLRGLKLITYHKTYIYFAERFGLEIVSELEEKPGIPPPPKHRDAIVELVKYEGIKLILNDNFYPRHAAEYVASKTGAKIITTFIDVGASEEVNTYENLISYLIEELKRAVS
ncbi:MAG: metal ABC transporter substrate-binding protein [Bacteroidota bacterium]